MRETGICVLSVSLSSPVPLPTPHHTLRPRPGRRDRHWENTFTGHIPGRKTFLLRNAHTFLLKETDTRRSCSRYRWGKHDAISQNPTMRAAEEQLRVPALPLAASILGGRGRERGDVTGTEPQGQLPGTAWTESPVPRPRSAGLSYTSAQGSELFSP